MIKRKATKKLLGIIGGMGPHADALFLTKLHCSTYAKADFEYVPYVCDGNCLRPDRSAFITGRSRCDPYPSLIRSLKGLERFGADVIAIPCNTAHAWMRRLAFCKRRGTLLLDMPSEAVRRCEALGLSTVCLLATNGTYSADVYGEHFFRLGIDCVIPPKKVRTAVYALISRIKAGGKTSLCELEPMLKDIPCDGFVLGCTELSLALENTAAPAYKYVDSLTALAEKAVKVFGKKLRQCPKSDP